MKKVKILAPLMAVATTAATLSPLMTVTSCGNKNEYVTTSEIEFIDGCNEICASGKNLVTCYKAIQFCQMSQYDILSFHLSKEGCSLAYDSERQCFVVLHDDEVVYAPDGYVEPTNKYNLWKFVTEYTKGYKYSQYITDDYYAPAGDYLEVDGGLDVGNNKSIQNVYYHNTSDTAKTVTLRTYCDILEIDASKDTVTHYDEANNVYVYSASHYIEGGKAAYLGIAKGKISFKYVDSVDCCSVDTFGCYEGVTFGGQETGACVYVNIGDYVPAETEFKPVYSRDQVPLIKITENETVNDFIEAVNNNQYCIIRLGRNLSFKDATTKTQFINITSDSQKACFLDLNGFTIDDAGAEAAPTYGEGDTLQARIRVGAHGNLTLLDSKRMSESGATTGAIKLTDSTITVCGTDEARANLLVEGVNINYTATTTNMGCIYLGTNGTDKATTHDSHCVVYGGTLTNKVEKAEGYEGTVGACGIVPRSTGAYLEMVYGTIKSVGYCISGNASGDGAYVDIVGGSFISDEICFYQPHSGTTNIRGGYFQGQSCILMKDGNVTISGGAFYALGQQPQTPIKSGQQKPDGSTIIIDAIGTSGYGVAPTLTVNDAVMLSAYNAILHGFVNKSFPSQKGADAWASFFGGKYMYADSDDGYYISDETTEQTGTNYFTVDKKTGSWIKIK